MHKQICSFLMLLTLSGSALQAYGDEPGFFEKRLHNPAYLYRYKTSRGNIVVFDVRKIVTLIGFAIHCLPTPEWDREAARAAYRLSRTTENPFGDFSLLTPPSNPYADTLSLIGFSGVLYMLYKDWRGVIGDIVVTGLFNCASPSTVITQGLWYAGQSLYSENPLPFSYEGEDAEEDETLEFAE